MNHLHTSIVAGGFALALFSTQPTAACHRFAHWAYPWPQKCGVAPARVATMRSVTALVEDDQRTPAEIADQAEHDAAVAAHHDEINAMMLILHVNETLE